MVAALSVHGDRIEAAHKQLVESRVGTTEERLRSLDRALELLAEATMARTDSHEAAEVRAHVHLQIADLVEDEGERDAALRRSADAFLETTELRPRELDAYLGAGAVWLRLSRRWDGDAAVEAADVAAATYERAFEQAHNNVALMKNWGVAIEGLHRLGASSYEARRAAFDAALRVHRGGNHDLSRWMRSVLAAPDLPAEPRIAPLVVRQRLD
jgi:tetratricopeptide (TPR) repeat protein